MVGELEQIQFLPGHASVRTTERYLAPPDSEVLFHLAVLFPPSVE